MKFSGASGYELADGAREGALAPGENRSGVEARTALRRNDAVSRCEGNYPQGRRGNTRHTKRSGSQTIRSLLDTSETNSLPGIGEANGRMSAALNQGSSVMSCPESQALATSPTLGDVCFENVINCDDPNHLVLVINNGKRKEVVVGHGQRKAHNVCIRRDSHGIRIGHGTER